MSKSHIKLLTLNQVEEVLQTAVTAIESNDKRPYSTTEVLSLFKLIDNTLIKQANINLSDGFALTQEEENVII